MPRFLIVLAIVTFFCGSASADEILDVSISGTFIATLPCSSNCTEAISINFEFDPEAYPRSADTGYALPGTLDVWASGFLGSFSSLSDQGGSGVISFAGAYMPFLDSGGDEVDIRFPVNAPTYFPIGVDTISMEFFSGAPRSTAYLNAFGSTCCTPPTDYKSSVEPVVQVREYGSKGMLLISATIIAFAMWRCGIFNPVRPLARTRQHVHLRRVAL
jgi:hypothetical protein